MDDSRSELVWESASCQIEVYDVGYGGEESPFAFIEKGGRDRV